MKQAKWLVSKLSASYEAATVGTFFADIPLRMKRTMRVSYAKCGEHLVTVTSVTHEVAIKQHEDHIALAICLKLDCFWTAACYVLRRRSYVLLMFLLFFLIYLLLSTLPGTLLTKLSTYCLERRDMLPEVNPIGGTPSH